MTLGVKGTTKDTGSSFTLPPPVVFADLAPLKNFLIVQILRPHSRPYVNQKLYVKVRFYTLTKPPQHSSRL